ncbi:hypothetical protein DSCA_23620 [Desulfosarcina alkanivorans]|jgi:uncharacterized cupin superfamily protein|uniref:Cupin type-2 domain-containing protein n=1 Tax=Desulfosarcina alkanivorans TaxID=571177 RepID=A0A5K7YFV6_9BACT|nr:cupin domain-containing protein [Desulfosarcina alkanivorans]BBO68432.1 hypothetical protein DSCA_23620 [Desulfosarcina alkanivorans]
MPTVFQTKDLALKRRKSRLPEFEWLTSPRLAKVAGAGHLEFDIRSLDPDCFSFPYHFHRAAEELFLVLSGEATLRSPEGFQKIVAGDLVFFERGDTGAHQVYNHGDAPCVYLDIRTTVGIDVCEYPDSGKMAVLPTLEVFASGSTVDYYQGEEDVRARWPAEILKKTLQG